MNKTMYIALGVVSVFIPFTVFLLILIGMAAVVLHGRW